jgi:tetratricopeptide (TPR) repeat protein
MSEPERSLYKFSRIFIKRLFPTIGGKMRYKDKLLFVNIVEKLPSIDSGYKDYDISPFLLLSAATAFEELDSLDKAMDYYRLSSNFMAAYSKRIENGDAILEIEDKELRRFAAYAKAKEGYIALKLGDKERAELCYKKAISIPDKDMQEYIKKYPNLNYIPRE